MKYTIEMHRRMQFIKQQIAECQRQWESVMPKNVSGQIAKDGKYSYRAKGETAQQVSQAEDFLREETGSRDVWDGVTSYLHELRNSIRHVRSELRGNVEEYAPVKRAGKYAQRRADDLLSNAFPRTSIDLHIGAGYEVGAKHNDASTKWNLRNDVTVGVAWFKSVGKRGFGLIKAPEGTLFVLRCKPRFVQYVDEDGMNAFEVQAVGFKHGKCYDMNGWLVTHQSSDHSHKLPLVCKHTGSMDIPHAFGVNLGKAHKLLQRRTVAHLTKQL